MNKPKRPRSAMWSRPILVACALYLCAGMAFAGPRHGKLASDLQNLKPGEKVDLIIQYATPPSTTTENKVLKFGGARHHKAGPMNNVRSYRGVGAQAIEDLKADSNVLHISPDRRIQATSTPAAIDYHNETIGSAAAWNQQFDGTGISVAVIDSGVSAVNDLPASKIVYNQDFFSPGGNASDQYGHGTHVAGIIAGTGADSKGRGFKYTFKGVAPGANIVNLRVLGPDGSGQDSSVIAAIDTAIQLKDTYNIRIINLSMGRGIFENYADDPLCQAVERAWNAGIFVVVSAGNEGRNNNAGTNGYATITAPGNDPYVITVGALNGKGTADRTDDIPATYSSKGPSLFDHIVKPDLVAPGNLIVSLSTPQETLYAQFPGNQVPEALFAGPLSKAKNNYFILSGTSMAAPMVSGAAALLLQQNPALTPDQLKFRLMKTAFKNLPWASSVTDPTTGQTFNMQADIFTVGSGLLDINAALNDTYLVGPQVGTAESPSVTVDANGNPSLVLAPNWVVWGSNGTVPEWVVWGSSGDTSEWVVWGSDSLANDQGEWVVWGSNALEGNWVVWGSDADHSEMVMWGSNAMFGQNSTSGESQTSAQSAITGDPW